MHYIGNDSNRVNVLSIGGGGGSLVLRCHTNPIAQSESYARVCADLKINQTDLNSTPFYINEIIMVRLTLH